MKDFLRKFSKNALLHVFACSIGDAAGGGVFRGVGTELIVTEQLLTHSRGHL